MAEWLPGVTLREKFPLMGNFAATIAFYFVLSIVPFLIVTFTVTSQFLPPETVTQLKQLVGQLAPEDIGVDMGAVIESAASASNGGVIGLTFIIALWSSSNVMSSLAAGLNFVLSQDKSTALLGLKARLYGIILLVVWMLTLMASATFLLISPSIENFLGNLDLVSQQALRLWGLIRLGASALTLFVALYLTYSLMPKKPVLTSVKLVASVAATVGWIVCSYFFSYLLPQIWSASALYGALASIVMVLMWAYACAWIILLGACWIVICTKNGGTPAAKKRRRAAARSTKRKLRTDSN